MEKNIQRIKKGAKTSYQSAPNWIHKRKIYRKNIKLMQTKQMQGIQIFSKNESIIIKVLIKKSKYYDTEQEARGANGRFAYNTNK